MPAFDASSMIYAWDNYPESQFPPLWEWLGREVTARRIVMSSLALDEVRHKAPECAEWLLNHGIEQLSMGSQELLEAARIKGLLGIRNDNYHPKGVDENDLFIIATCKLRNLPLVSNEERQTNLPQMPAKMKIPAVCDLGAVGVQCTDFLAFIKQSSQVFR